MASGVPRCPNCGEILLGGAMVCKDCGKIYCDACTKKGLAPGGGQCPRCFSVNWVTVSSWDDIFNAMKIAQN